MGLLGASPGPEGFRKTVFWGGVAIWGTIFRGGGNKGGGGGGGILGGGWGGGCVHQNRACTSKVPGGFAKTTDLSNY